MATDRSEWYTAKSVPISEIPKEELDDAFHAFTNNNQIMVDLLWTCYNNGILTLGNHIRENSYFGYLEIDYCSSNREALKKLINICLNLGKCGFGTNCFGNVFSGPTWDNPTISISPSNMLAEEFFKNLNHAFLSTEKPEENLLVDLFFEFEDLLIEKDLPYGIHVDYDGNGYYVFEFANHEFLVYTAEHIKQIMASGMENVTIETYTLDDPSTKKERDFVGFFGKDKEEFTKRVRHVLYYFKNDFVFTRPSPDDDHIGYDYKVHLLKQIYLQEGPEGGKKLNDWINSHKWNPKLDDVDYKY